MAAYHRVYDSRHQQDDCQEPGSAMEPYARQLSKGCLFSRINDDKQATSANLHNSTYIIDTNTRHVYDRPITSDISQRVPAVCSMHTDNLRRQEFCHHSRQWTSCVDQFTCVTAIEWRHGGEIWRHFCSTVLTISHVDSYREMDS